MKLLVNTFYVNPALTMAKKNLPEENLSTDGSIQLKPLMLVMSTTMEWEIL